MCVLLDYGAETKGYRLWDPRRAKVFYRRDVLFDESSRGIEEEPSKAKEKNEKWHVKIDSLRDQEQVVDEEPVVEETTEPVLQRSERKRRPPDYYGEWVTVSTEPDEPKTARQALASPDKAKWMAAMEKEIESLRVNDAWDLVIVSKSIKDISLRVYMYFHRTR